MKRMHWNDGYWIQSDQSGFHEGRGITSSGASDPKHPLISTLPSNPWFIGHAYKHLDEEGHCEEGHRLLLGMLLHQDDILETVLSFVDLASLRACYAVCKSWNSILNTESFCRRWCHNSGDKEPLLILILANTYGGLLYFDPSWVWDPSQSKFLRKVGDSPLSSIKAVASAGGLVCVLTSQYDDVYHLAMGNPVTRKWSELPPLHFKDKDTKFIADVDFTMSVYDEGFKVAVYYTAPDASGHRCCIYDSATGAWSSLPELPFSQAYVKARVQWNAAYDRTRTQRNAAAYVNPTAAYYPDPSLSVFPDSDNFYYDLSVLGFYDIGDARWSSGAAIRSLRITTGLEGKAGVRCVLARPGTCTRRLWEHNGQRYFASGWVYVGGWNEEGDDGVDGFGVWKIDENGGLVTASAVVYRAIWEEFFPRVKRYHLTTCCRTEAKGDLVTFWQLTAMFCYCLSTDRWGGVEQKDLYFKTDSVLYQPSLRKV